MNTEREKAIDAYIKQHDDSKLPGPLPISIHGTIDLRPVYRLPINLLIFNLTNGRFAAELLDREEKEARSLDSTITEDAAIIRKFLLDQNEAETNALTDELVKNGQLDPGIITFDGAVINGNRRMSILQTLKEKTGDEKYDYLIVARLPRGVDHKDLWRIEAKLQFGRDYRLEYGAVNELLKIRAGRLSGLGAKEISQALIGRYSEKQVEDRLKILKLIENYLVYIGKPKQYKLIQENRIVEHFNSLHNNVISSLANSAQRGDIPKLTEIAFALTSTGNYSHWNIRELKKIAQVEKAKKELFKAFDGRGKLANKAVVTNAFSDAQSEVENKKYEGEPERLAKRALSALQGIDSAHSGVGKVEVQELLAEIKIETNRLIAAGVSSGKKTSKR